MNSERLSLHGAEAWAAVPVKNLKTEMADLVNWYWDWQLGCRKIAAIIDCLRYLNGATPHFHFHFHLDFHSFADSDSYNVTVATAVENYSSGAANYLTRPGDPGHS